jgi:hypothetical protein
VRQLIARRGNVAVRENLPGDLLHEELAKPGTPNRGFVVIETGSFELGPRRVAARLEE